MRYCFDIDGTLCDTPNNEKGKPDYLKATSIPFMVERVNQLYDEGNYIILMTARGRGSGIDWTDTTKQQLADWGIKYHELEPMFHKPTADIFIDDKGIDVEDWKKTQPIKKGIIGGAFDIIHPGYIRMFKQAKRHCNHLTVALHVDPSTERNNKLQPVQTVEDRTEILLALKDVDEVITYSKEDDFLSMLSSGKYDCRILGDDYKDGTYKGKDIDIPIVWIPRDHGYSTTKLKTKIYESLK